MKTLIKPPKLNPGDKVATVSPSWGVAGEPDTLWKYQLGITRLKSMGLTVAAAPYSMKGTKYLAENPQARTEDVHWAFEKASCRKRLRPS